jgi:hypothetical protein
VLSIRLYLPFFIKKYPQWRKRVLHQIERRGFDKRINFDSSLNHIIYKDFETQESDVSFNGTGAFFMKKGKYNLIDSTEISSELKGEYELSFWVYFDERQYSMPEPIWYEWNKEGRRLQRTKVNYRAEHNVFNSWVRFDHKMTINPEHNYLLEIKGRLVTIDELIVKPTGVTNYIKTDRFYDLYNNYPLLKTAP